MTMMCSLWLPVILDILLYTYTLYLLGRGGGDEKDYEKDDDGGSRIYLSDPWWADKISDDQDLFDVDVDDDGGMAGPSIGNASTSNLPAETQSDEYDEEGDEEGDDKGIGRDGGEEAEDHSAGNYGGRSQSCGKFVKSFEDDNDDENNSKIGRSDILVSQVISDEDDGITYVPSFEPM
jgi:hypothetical protein